MISLQSIDKADNVCNLLSSKSNEEMLCHAAEECKEPHRQNDPSQAYHVVLDARQSKALGLRHHRPILARHHPQSL